MSISPIMSSISPMIMSYSASNTVQSQDNEHKMIIQSLQKMGITATGDKETDKLLLNNIHEQILKSLSALGLGSTGAVETDKILLEYVQNLVASQQSEQANSSSYQYIPFEDVMNAINITPTGDIDKDYDDTITELDYRISTAADEEEEAYYEALKSEVEELYSDHMYSQSRNSFFIGSGQISSINRYLMV